MSQGEHAREGRSAAVVAGGILSSKLVGLVRQRITAHFFGIGFVADVIAAAFRIGNVSQNLLGEGTLSASFIPIYAKLRAEERHDEAESFARAALGLLVVVVVLVSAIGVALAPQLSLMVAAGFEPEKLAMTTRLVRIIFPMTGILVLCAWALGVLNTHRRFFLPYAAPIIWSAAQIAALIIGGGWLLYSGEALARVLAFGALAGAVLEFLALLTAAKPWVKSLRPQFDTSNPHVREAAKRLPAVILGRGVIQLSGIIDTLLVSFLGSGANATFAYAQMLYLLPMSLLGTGEAAVSLPAMARETAGQDVPTQHARMRQRLGVILTRVIVLSVPATIALAVFGREIIGLLLQTGAFDARSTVRVAAALSVYGFALLGNASVRLFATTFFALGDTRTPARYAVVRVVVSTVIAVSLMRRYGVVGVVVGATSAAWLEAAMLGQKLRSRIGGLGLQALPYGRITLLAGTTLGPAWAVRAWLGETSYADSMLASVAVLGTLGLTFLTGAMRLGLLDPRSLLKRG
ncbi:MAG: murein biosynthesis integral membrane protein MurJ [Polyangiaceae bacterium]